MILKSTDAAVNDFKIENPDELLQNTRIIC